MDWLWFILIGITGGVLGGMGMGGGTLLIPLLTIFLKVEQNVAQGINLLAFLPMSVVALFIHFKNKMVDCKKSWPIIAMGVLGAVGGALLAGVSRVETLKICFAIFLIVLGAFQFISVFVNFSKNKKNKQQTQK